jgi:type IV secretory pathway VirB4 component
MAAEGAAILRPAVLDPKPVRRPGCHNRIAETEDAIAQASSQLVAYGYYTPVVILFDDDREAL